MDGTSELRSLVKTPPQIGEPLLEEHFPSAARRASVPSSVINLSNTILGSGTLAMSLACKRSGMLVFVALLAAVASCAHYSIGLLIKVTDALNISQPKYPELGSKLFGRPGEYVCALSVILQQTGACIAYVVIIADVLVPILALEADSSGSLLCKRYPWQILIVALVIFPLCLLRHMDSLKYTSAAAVIFILSFTVAVVANGFRVLADTDRRQELYHEHFLNSSHTPCHLESASRVDPPGTTVHLFPTDKTILNALPIVCFAFLCHMNAFPIYAELQDRSEATMRRVSGYSMIICSSIYFSAGAFGYLTFLDSTQDNLMLNFETAGSHLSIIMDVLRVCFGAALIFSYPVIVYEARHGIEKLLFPAAEFSWTRHVILNAVLVTVTCIVGILVPKIDTVFGLVGSTTSPTIVFILPAVFYLQVQGGPWLQWKNALPLSLLVVGTVLIPVALYAWAAEL